MTGLAGVVFCLDCFLSFVFAAMCFVLIPGKKRGEEPGGEGLEGGNMALIPRFLLKYSHLYLGTRVDDMMERVLLTRRG